MDQTPASSEVPELQRDIFTVSRLNREVRASLESGFPLLWIEGEISNLARPRSGHFYFSLKDELAQVRCAMFRNRNMHLKFTPEDGMQVLTRARISLYEARGEFQLIIEHMEEAGDGALRRAFDALKQRLDSEGLFDSSNKKPLPDQLRTVGVITSPTGAAIHDILSVLERRSPATRVVLYPVAVQGEDSADEIVAAIRLAEQRAECDVLIVGRGGGSLEDLWSFNEEQVARAIYQCQLPVVSAVGHEIDFTIADFVADHRAATPSAAAELLSTDQLILIQRLKQQQERLQQVMENRLRRDRQLIDLTRRRLIHPGRRLQEISQRLDELEQRLNHAHRSHSRHRLSRIIELHARLRGQDPRHRLQRQQDQQRTLEQRIHQSIRLSMERTQQQIATLAHSLNTVSPLATLSRGYSITTSEEGKILRNSHQVEAGSRIKTRLASGQLHCLVEESAHEDN